MRPKKIGAAKELAEGASLPFTFLRGGRVVYGFVARFRGRWVAYENECRHLPLTLDYNDGRFFTADGKHFICQSHGALYDPVNGQCVRGPCVGARLKPLSVEERGGNIYLVRRRQRTFPLGSARRRLVH